MASITLSVSGMSCNHCVTAIQTAVGELNGVKEVNVSLDKNEVAVSYDETAVAEDKIRAEIEDQGYEVN